MAYIPVEPLFTKGDYIINRTCGDMAIVNSVDKKNYYHFKAYYNKMFNILNDPKNYTLQVNYQKFFERCTDEEIKEMDRLIKELKD